MSLIVYADFNTPECYLASRRVDALRAVGVEVDWRAVEHEPRLPLGGRPVSADERNLLFTWLGEDGGLLLPSEQVPWRMPRIVSKTEAAVSAFAEACGAGVSDEVRRLLFTLYWVEGADIGNPAALRTPLAPPILRGHSQAYPLREAGFAVSIDGGPITTEAYQLIRSWRTEWQQLDCAALPILLVDGATLTGVEAVRRLAKEMIYAGVSPAADLADPRRYPKLDGRPPASWVSQVGGRWRYAYQRVATTEESS